MSQQLSLLFIIQSMIYPCATLTTAVLHSGGIRCLSQGKQMESKPNIKSDWTHYAWQCIPTSQWHQRATLPVSSLLWRIVGQMITASISGLHREIWIWLWSCYFVSTAVHCMQLTADSSLQTTLFFILSLDTPCFPFIIYSVLYSFHTSISPAVFFLSIPFSFSLSLNFVLLFKTFPTWNLLLSPSDLYFLSPPFLLIIHSIDSHAPLWSKSDCNFATSASIHCCYDSSTARRPGDNTCMDSGKHIVLWSRGQLNPWSPVWETLNVKHTAAPTIYAYVCGGRVVLIDSACLPEFMLENMNLLCFYKWKPPGYSGQRKINRLYKLWPIVMRCQHSVEESQCAI